MLSSPNPYAPSVSRVKEQIKQELKADEGQVKRGGRHVVYDDATGKPLKKGDTLIGNPTIGWGRNLAGKGLSDGEAEIFLNNDFLDAAGDLYRIFGDGLGISLPRWEALLNLRYNLGPGGFRSFKNMIKAVHERDWERAAAECLDFKAARELPGRYKPLAKALREG